MKENRKTLAEYKNQGKNYYQSEQYLLAIEAYKKAIEIDSKDPTLHCNIGLCYQKLKQNSQAYDSFKSVLTLEPNHLKALFNQGKICYAEEKYIEVVRNFNKVLKSQDLAKETKYELLKYIEKCDFFNKPSMNIYIADVKLTEQDEIKILELGTFEESQFSGFKSSDDKTIFQITEETLKKMNKKWDVDFIDIHSSEENQKEIVNKIRKKQYGKTFFQEQLDSDFDSTQQIVIGKAPFLKNMGANVLLVNRGHANAIIPRNKKFTSRIIDKKYRPKYVLVPKNIGCDQSTYEKIKEFQGENVIIKQLNLSGGKGVHIVKKDMIAINEKIKTFQQNAGDDEREQLEPHCLIEEIAHSKLHKGYDGTIRAIFLLAKDKGKNAKKIFKLIDAYLKLPAKTSTGAMTIEELISSYTDGRHRHDSDIVSEQDKKLISEQLEKAMGSDAFSAILEKNLSMHEDVQILLNSKEPLEKQEGLLFLFLLFNHYYETGQIDLAEYSASLFVKHAPDLGMGYSMSGAICATRKNFPEAIKNHRQAIEKENTSFKNNVQLARHYLQLGNCYFENGQDKEGFESSHQSMKYNPTVECCGNLAYYYHQKNDRENLVKYKKLESELRLKKSGYNLNPSIKDNTLECLNVVTNYTFGIATKNGELHAVATGVSLQTFNDLRNLLGEMGIEYRAYDSQDTLVVMAIDQEPNKTAISNAFQNHQNHILETTFLGSIFRPKN